MATIKLDELITELKYNADLKALDKAEKAVKELEKQNKATATATDTLTQAQMDLGEEIAKETRKFNRLKDSQAELTRQIKLSGRATKTQKLQLLSLNSQVAASARKTRDLRMEQAQLTRQKNRVARGASHLTQEQRKLSTAMRQTTQRMREQKRAADKLAAAQSRARAEAVQSAKQRVSEAGAGARAGGGVIAGAIGAGAAGTFAIGKQVLETGTSFEKLRARLKTVEGSALGANAAFSLIQNFTKSTPFQLEEVTTAFVRLKSLGLDASQESLTAFGNLAAAQGKSIIDFIEAVADASTGEFERLKEFGIKASSQGDQVAFTFKGQTTTVGKNATEIQAFLKNLGETEFGGAMADQMATASGAISNFQDTIQVAFDTVAQMGPLEEFKGLLSDLSGVAGDQGLAAVLAEGLTKAIRLVREAVGDLTQEDIRGFLNAMSDAAMAVLNGVKLLIDVFQTFTKISGDTGTALETMTLLAAGFAAALTGPGGIVIAAGLVGAALGEMAANGIASLTGLNDELATLDARINQAQERIRQSNAAIEASENRILAERQAREKGNAEREKRARERIEKEFGGAGKGLFREEALQDSGDVFLRANQLFRGDELRQAAEAELLTGAGQKVVTRVRKAEEAQIEKVAQRAGKEAKRSGATAEKVVEAQERARESARAAAAANRKKALEVATKTFAETGSAEAAATAAERAVAGRGKKGAPKKGKKSDEKLLTEEIEKQIKDLALQAGKRAASRALLRGESAARANELQRAKQKEVQARFTQQFEETGRLPPGLATSLTQTAALPDVEKVAGPVSAPVLTVNNYRTEITGNTIVNEVNIAGGVSATPEQITGAIAQSQAVTFADFGAAIIAKTTNIRR